MIVGIRRNKLLLPLPSFPPSHGSPSPQSPLRRLHSGSPLRYDLPGAVLSAHPCCASTTEGGKRILQAKDQQPRSERSTKHATIRHQTSARRSQVVSLVS